MSNAPDGPERRERAWQAAAAVTDPEIPVLTIADLGVLRDVSVAADGAVEVAITPTYSGCPAMAMIALDVETALARAGLPKARGAHRAVAGLDHGLDVRSRPPQAAQYGIAPPPPPGAGRGRCSARRMWRVRTAARPTPNGWRHSVPPRARRCGAAGPAASRSTPSSATDRGRCPHRAVRVRIGIRGETSAPCECTARLRRVIASCGCVGSNHRHGGPTCCAADAPADRLRRISANIGPSVRVAGA